MGGERCSSWGAQKESRDTQLQLRGVLILHALLESVSQSSRGPTECDTEPRVEALFAFATRELASRSEIESQSVTCRCSLTHMRRV